jgi:carbon starvation protein
MADLASSVGEKTMVGRTGGAPTFALGMAQMLGGRASTAGPRSALWYHFAIMFEALFILTTHRRRHAGRPLHGPGPPRPRMETARRHAARFAGNVGATALFVAAWGWFLYQGVVDPLGGINSLWPIFGVANQLLAVIASPSARRS